jgi:gliding motility-associated-like protein
MKNTAYIFFLLLAGKFCAQTITPQVINSAGDHRQVGTSNVWVTDNVGEPFTETIGPNANIMITQGFIQPEKNDGVTILFSGLTCKDKDDGFISVSYQPLNPTDVVTYIWSGDACPSNNCGNKVTNLKPGDYTVTVISTHTTSGGPATADTIKRDAKIVNSDEPCRLKIFSGVTANNDGINDVWVIENITEFPNNHVSIFSRWGTEVFDAKGYDNETKFWPTSDMVNRLVASTYFYIVDLGDGSKPIKGWVELIKN